MTVKSGYSTFSQNIKPTAELFCPVCMGVDVAAWGESAGYLLYRCRACGHRFADVRGHTLEHDDPDLFRTSFTHGLMSSDIDYYTHLCNGEGPGLPTSVTVGHIMELCTEMGINGGRWLDVGCGSAYLLEMVKQIGWEAVGVEPGGWGQIAAQQKRVQIVQGFLSSDTFDTAFDVVSATDVLEHQPAPYPFLALLRHHVRPNGYIIVSFPYADSLLCRMLGAKWNMVAPPTHCQFFSKASLQVMADKAGLYLRGSHQFSLLHLRGASRYSAVRRIVDSCIDVLGGGDQAVAILQRKGI